jgi:hypothetical protein
VLGFAVLGLIVPITLMIRPFVLGRSFGDWSVRLWPSSMILMALDMPEPSPVSTVAIIYALALAFNVLLYAGVGIVLWPAARFSKAEDVISRQVEPQVLRLESESIVAPKAARHIWKARSG